MGSRKGGRKQEISAKKKAQRNKNRGRGYAAIKKQIERGGTQHIERG